MTTRFSMATRVVMACAALVVASVGLNGGVSSAADTTPLSIGSYYQSDDQMTALWVAEDDHGWLYVSAVRGTTTAGAPWTTWPWSILNGDKTPDGGYIWNDGTWAMNSALEVNCAVGIALSGVFGSGGNSTTVSWTDIECADGSVLAPAATQTLDIQS